MRQNNARSRWSLISPLLSGIFALAFSLAAEQKFTVSEVSMNSEMMICDLDGDGLKDLVFLDDTNLSVFFQDRAQGFTREPQLTYHLEHRPSIVWTAKLAGPAESVLVMTSDGVTELKFTNRTGPPVSEQIIRQQTIIPDAAEGPSAMHLPLSAETGRGWPLLLLPTTDGIQIWQHGDGWHQAQVIGQCIESYLWPAVAGTNPGFITRHGLDLSVGDVNGDGRDDLMIRRSRNQLTNIYTLYLQQTNGLFGLEPALTYADPVKPLSWLCWLDLNRDGKVDLIKSVRLNEPTFMAGIPSAKVLVSIFVADAQGRIPAEPQQVLRKNEWAPSLPVVDVDGDGFPDLVLGYCHMGDTKEDAIRFITTKQVEYNLKFYFYRPRSGFPKGADCQRQIFLHLDRDEWQNWIGSEDYGSHVNVGGDFNGDGKTDLLVRERDEILVYFFVSREKGFSLKPDLRFSCPARIDGWETVDLNNDGVSDLIVKLAKKNGYRIFISQK